MGTPTAAVPTLEALVAHGHEIPLVVCQPDRPLGRSKRLQPPPVKECATRLGLTVFQPLNVRNREFRERIASVAPDVLVVVAYGKILGERTLAVAPHGAVNVHFSLLPAYRGAAPVHWALARQESTTGVTTMQMNRGLDAGDILLRQELKIAAGEHCPSLTTRLAQVGAELLLKTLEGLEEGSLAPIAQDHRAATFARPIVREDGCRSPSETAPSIAAFVQALDPWPGVWFRHRSKRVRVLQATPSGRFFDGDFAPGTVVAASKEGLWIVCGDTTFLLIQELQFEGRKPVGAADAVNGRSIEIGDRLEADSPQAHG